MTRTNTAAVLFPFRWAILLAAFVIHACLMFCIMIVPGLAVTLMNPESSTALSATGFSMVATMPYLTGFLFGIPSGMLADRKGLRLVMIVGLATAFIGAGMRIFSNTFPMLLLSSFLMGVALAALNANSTKLLGLWFPGKNISVAMGVYVLGATVGAMLALMLGPQMPSVSFAFTVAAVAAAFALLVWLLLGRRHPNGEAVAAEPVVRHLGAVVKSKNVWLISIFMFFLFGCTVTQQTFSNVAFTELTGDASLAGLLSAVNTISVGIGGIIMPSVVSRMKTLKPIMIASGIINAALLYSVLSIGFGPIVWFLLVFQGFMLGVLLPMGKTLPALLPDVKVIHLGAAGGLQSMLQNLGAWLIPAYIIAPFCTAFFGASSQSMYIAAGTCTLVCALCISLVPETGTSIEAKLQREAATAKDDDVFLGEVSEARR